MRDRYVLSLRKTGLGDRIVCLCAAWIFAKTTGRTLVVDWRHSLYADGPLNLFPMCFDTRETLAGVPFIAHDRLDTSLLPRPIDPWVWGVEGLVDSPWLVPTDSFPDECTRAVALIRAGVDVEAPTVVFNGCLVDGLVSFDHARSCLEGLQPVREIADIVDAFDAAHLRPAPCIGLHVRHGNGGDIMGHSPFWHSFDTAILRCARAVALARTRMAAPATVFLCTDSPDVEVAIKNAVPGVICRPKAFREPGAGELHHGADAAMRLRDALVEMLLLARCTALVRYPPKSFFSFYAAVMKRSENPSPATIRDLQAPWDASDALSPSVLF